MAIELMEFILGDFHVILPKLVHWTIFFLGAYAYFSDWGSEERRGWERIFRFRNLIIATLIFYVFYAALLTGAQYYVWAKNPIGQMLLTSELDEAVPVSSWLENLLGMVASRHEYFGFYAYSRFWFGGLISVFMAYAFYLFLRSLKKFNERFFYEGEVELGLLMALVVGWPKLLLFIGLIFFSVVIVSIGRLLMFEQKYSTLGEPFLLATLIVLIWGEQLVRLFHMQVLRA